MEIDEFCAVKIEFEIFRTRKLQVVVGNFGLKFNSIDRPSFALMKLLFPLISHQEEYEKRMKKGRKHTKLKNNCTRTQAKRLKNDFPVVKVTVRGTRVYVLVNNGHLRFFICK